jgi:hypothetical protein
MWEATPSPIPFSSADDCPVTQAYLRCKPTGLRTPISFNYRQPARRAFKLTLEIARVVLGAQWNSTHNPNSRDGFAPEALWEATPSPILFSAGDNFPAIPARPSQPHRPPNCVTVCLTYL